MTDVPWTGDACSLVDAFRDGTHSPTEELEATLAAIERSDINAFSHLDPERARAAAADADVSLPFGGVPTGIKELERLAGWPQTEGSLVFTDRVASVTSVHTARLLDGGAVPVGLTCASEFGGLNISVTRLNGVTHNPWQRGRTAGGSSGGSAAAVAGGLVTLASGGDGGGSIRIPAGYTGLLGMKGTFGRIPRSPTAYCRPNTVVLGNLARSVRDAARYFDVCGGFDGADPSSLPRHPGFEAGLGSHDLRGRKVAIIPAIGGVTLEPGVEDHLRTEIDELVAATGMVAVDFDAELPNFITHWMMGNMSTLLADLGDRWPGCASEMTDEISGGLFMSQALYNLATAARAEELRIELNEALAGLFEQVDFIVAATNPGPAFAADAPTSNPQGSFVESALSSTVGKVAFRGALGAVRAVSAVTTGLPNRLIDATNRSSPDLVAMGGLTVISNVYGNPAVSIPAGTIGGLPVGLQVLAPHHHDELLFDVALAMERHRPWPLTAGSSNAESFNETA
ncbi:MAG: amidase [Acidimicrobiales bacterium]